MSDQLFIQQITYNGKDLPLELLKSSTLTYSVNSLSPYLVLKFLNPHNTFLEDFELREKGEIKVRTMDYFSDSDEGIIQDFVICDIPPHKNNAFLIVECLEKSAYELTRTDIKIFNDKPVEYILKALAPDMKIDCGSFPGKQTYHLPNKKRFTLIRRMARELGAVVFTHDGTIVFKSKKDLLRQSDLAEYEYRNEYTQYRIHRPRLLNRSYITDEQKRHYIGWHIENGWIKSTENADYPIQMVSCNEVGKLNNLNQKLEPAVLFRTLGEGKLKIGSPIKLTWHTGIPERSVDESYPDRVLISDIVFFSKFNFTCDVCGSI